MVKVISKKKRLTPIAVFSSLLLMIFTAFCAASMLPALAQPAQQVQQTNQPNQTSDTNVQSVGSTQKSYFDRNPEAKAYMDLKGEGKTDNDETEIDNPWPYDYKTPPHAWRSKSPSKSSKYDTDTYTCTGAPCTDTTDAIHGNHVVSRALEKAFIPERMMHAATGVAGVAANNAANSEASMAVNQAFSAIDYSKQFLANFTAEPGNVWQAIRDQLFIPMAVLLLLPGAVLAQVRAIVAQGSPVLIGQEVHPFEGILRSIVAIFLIPATFLVINYGIDVANSITFTIADEYRRLFGSDMYEDAKCAIQRAYPTNKPQDNRNAIDQTAQPRASGGLTVFATLERNTIGLALIDPCLGIYESIMPDETVPQAVNIMRSVLNGMGASAAMSWNVACAFQMAFLYYLWCMGPIAAALWVWPIAKMRASLGTWVEGVVTICFWSLFWNTVILLIACFKGVGFTGTIIVSALLSLAILSIKSAFDFSGLAASAAEMAMSQALKAAQQASKGGGGGGGGSGNSGGGSAKQGGQSAPSSGDKHQPSKGDNTGSATPTQPSSTPAAAPSTSSDSTSSTRSPNASTPPGGVEGNNNKPADDATGAPPGTTPNANDAAKSDANKGPEVAPPPNAGVSDSDKANAANKGDASDAANKGKEAGKGEGAGAGLPPGAGAGLGAGNSGPTNTSGVDVKGNAVVNQSHDAKTSSDDKLSGKDQASLDPMGSTTGFRDQLPDTSGTRGLGAGVVGGPNGPNGPNGPLDANGKPVGSDVSAMPGGPNDPNNPQRLAGDASTTQNATGIPTVAPDANKFDAGNNTLARDANGQPGSLEAKAISSVTSGENANLYKAAVSDPNGINPSGVSNADAFRNATGVSAQSVADVAQNNPQTGKAIEAAISGQTQDRSGVGSVDTARSINGNPPADPGAPVSGQGTSNTGSPTQPATSDVFRSGTADVTTAGPAPQPGPTSLNNSGQPVSGTSSDVVSSNTAAGHNPAVNTEPVRSGGFDNSAATVQSGNPVQTTHQPGSSDNMRVANADTSSAAPLGTGTQTSPQPVSGEAVRTTGSDMSNTSVQSTGAPQVSPQPNAGDSFRANTVDNSGAVHNPGAPVAPQPNSGDSFRANTVDNSGAAQTTGAPVAPQPNSGDSFRANTVDNSGAVHNPGAPVAPQPNSGDSFRANTVDNSGAVHNPGAPVAPQPNSGDSFRANTVDNSGAVHNPGAPVAQQPNSGDSFRANTVDNSGAVHNPGASVAPQPNSGDSFRANTVDNSGAVHNPGAPVAQQPNSGDSFRANTVDNSGAVHNPGAPVAPQPNSGDSFRANTVDNSGAVHNPGAPVAQQPNSGDSFRANTVDNSGAVHNPGAPVAQQPNSGDSFRANTVDNSGAAQTTGASVAPQQNSGDSFRANTVDNSGAVHNPGAPVAPQPNSGDSFRANTVDNSGSVHNPGAPVAQQPNSGDSFRANTVDNSGAVHNPGAPVAQQPNSSDSFRANTVDNSGAVHNTGAPVAPQPSSGDSYRANPVENSAVNHAPQMQANTVEPTRSYGGDTGNATVHAPASANQPANAEPIRTASSDAGYTPAQPSVSGQPTVQTSGDTFRSGGYDNSGAATVHQNGPVPGAQPTVNNDSTRVNNYDTSHNTAVNPVQSQPGVTSEPSRSTTYDNSNAGTMAHGPASVTQPGANNEPARVTNYDGGTVSPTQPGYQPQQSQQPPQQQSGSPDVMRTSSYDNSSNVNQQVSGTPNPQPPAQQYTGEQVRSTSYDNAGGTANTVHPTGTGQPNIQSGGNEQARVNSDSTASAYAPQYNSTQHVTPPVGSNQVSSNETHMRTADSGSGIISPASGGPTPVSFTTNASTVSPSNQHVPNSGGEVRFDNPTQQSQGTSWTNNPQPGQTWTQANEPERPNQNWGNQTVNREAVQGSNQPVANNNMERQALPEQRPPERAEYRAESSSNAYVPPIIGQAPQSAANAPAHYADPGRVNEAAAHQQNRIQEQAGQVERQQQQHQQQQRAQEQQKAAEAQRQPSGNQSRPPAQVPPQVFVQPHQQQPAKPDAQRPPQQQANPQQAKQAEAAPPPEAPKSKDNPLAPNNSAKSGGPSQKSINDVLRGMGQAPGQKKKKPKPGDPPEQ